MIEKEFNSFHYCRKKTLNYLTNISPEYKILYFEIPKTGCSTVKKTLQSIESNGLEIQKSQIHDKPNSPLKGIFNFQEPQKLLISDKYFKFTFVRNPYERVLSAYLDKIVANPWERKRRVADLGFRFEDNISFLDFLYAIDKKTPLQMDIHWKPQAYMLPSNLDLLDYIAHFENFSKEWEVILDILRQRVPISKKNLFHSQDVIFHQTNAAEKLQKYYCIESKTLVQRLYDIDFKRFGYDR